MAEIVRRRPRWLGRTTGWPFQRLFEEMFEDFGESFLPERWTERRFVPAIDVSEDENELTITAELPGMDREDLEVTVDNGVLCLRGEKKEEEVSEEADYHRVERRYGQFERRMRLPGYVNADKIQATYEHGVLKLTLPKTEAAKARSIQIK